MKSDAGDELTYAVIGRAMEVHRALGPGLDEMFYHDLLSEKLRAAGIEHRFKARGQLVHRGVVADQFEADIVVLDRLVAELKTLWADFAADHFTQILCYQKFWGIGTGLLFDFAKESLVHRRVAYTPVARPLEAARLAAQAPEFIADRALMKDLCDRFTRLYEQYGLGYRDTTYRGLILADLSADGVSCQDQPPVTVRLAEAPLGQARLNCIAVDNRCALLIVALRTQINAATRAILQTYLKQLEVPWGMVVNFGKSELQVTFVKAPHR